jgi:LEA14-like dessication related protein
MRELLTSALLGSKLRILLTLTLALGVAVGGGLSLGVLGAPSVAGVQNSFGTVTDETTEIRTDLVVENPNPIGVSLGSVSVSYDVTMNDVAMANGSKDGVSVGTGNSTVEFVSEMRNDRIPAWWVSHIRNDEETTLRVDASVQSGTLGRTFEAPPVERTISTDLISQFNSSETRPVNASQPLVSDPVAYVNETSAQWGAVTDARTPIDMRFEIYNPKTTPLTITEIGYTITMNNITVGNGTSQSEHVIEGHSSETIETRTAIRNEKLDQWWVSHLQNGQITDLRIDFYAKMEVGGETFRVPLDEMTYTKTIETDIFGNKDSDAGNSDDSRQTTTGNETTEDGGANDSEETTASDGSDGSDETATTADGETTTESGDDGTTTDDGLLDLAALPTR